jgi:hypothetical protein
LLPCVKIPCLSFSLGIPCFIGAISNIF